MRGNRYVSGVKLLAKHSLLYSTGDLLTRVTTFFLGILYTYHLGKGGYGTYALIDVVRILFAMVAFNTAANVVIRFFFDFADPRDRERFLGTLFLTLILSACFVVGFSELLGPRLSAVVFEIPYRSYTQYAVWVGAIEMLTRSIALNLLKARQLSFRYLVYCAASAIIRACLALVFVVSLSQGVVGALKVHLYEAVLIGLPLLLSLRGHIRFTWNRAHFASLVRFSLPLVFLYLSSWGLSLFDRVILNRYVALEHIGVYAFGFQIGMLVNMLVGSINSAWGPHFLSLVEKRDSSVSISELATYVMGAIAVSGVAVAAMADPVIRLIAEPSFHSSAAFVPWIALGYVFLGLGVVPRNVLLYQKKSLALLLTIGSSLAASIGLNFLLVPRWGTMAAAIDCSLAFGVSCVVSLALAAPARLVRYQKIRISKLLIVCATVAILALQIHTASPVSEILLRTLALVIGLPVALWLIRFFNPQETAAMKRSMQVAFGR